MCDTAPRISDLSAVEPENFKTRNTALLMGTSHYDTLPGQDAHRTREKIWSVRNSDLRRALWMRAVVGKYFFLDANHRTAMALLRQLLRTNGVKPGSWPVERTKMVR